jgi:hypothetical protein
MTNLIPANVNIPAHLANRIGAPSSLSKALSGGIGGSTDIIPKISIKGSRFRIVEGKTETVLNTLTLDVIIVGANPRLSKTYYAAQWSPESEPASPDCWSMDGIRPHPDAANPQHDMCQGCPQNAWGSKVTAQGKEIKACSDKKRLAVVAADDPGGPVYLLEVTPAALQGLGKYQKELSSRGIPVEIVRTVVGFDTDASFPKLNFKFGGFINEEAQNLTAPLLDSEEVMNVTGQAEGSTHQDAGLPSPAPVLPAPPPPPPPPPPPAPAQAKRGFASQASVLAPPANLSVVRPSPASTGDSGNSDGGVGAAVKRGRPAKVATPEPQASSSLVDDITSLLAGMASDD